MRFVAGRGALEETLAGCTVVDLLARAPDEVLLAEAPWRQRCCWQGRRGGKPSGRCCWPGRRYGATAERRRCGRDAGRGAVAQHNTRRGRWCGHTSGSSWQREEAGIGKQRYAAGRSRQAEASRCATILCNCCCPNSGCRACILASLWLLRGPPVFGT